MTIGKVWYAYVHSKPDGVPFYVGKGTLRRARYLGERNEWHQRTVAKYGRCNIAIMLIRCETEEVAFSVERALIAAYRRTGIALCNWTDGGEGGSNPGPETRERLRIAARKRGISQATRDAAIKAKANKPLSDEQKRKQSESMMAFWTTHVMTDQHRKNLSEAAKQRGISEATRLASKRAMIGSRRPHSEDTKRKIGIANKGRISPVVIEAARVANLGKKRPHTEETKEKIRQGHLRRRRLLISDMGVTMI